MIEIVWKGPSGLTPYGFKKEGDVFLINESDFEKLKNQKLASLNHALKKAKEKSGGK